MRASLLLIGLLAALLAHGTARASRPARSLAQFHHTRWTQAEGAPVDIRAIVQAADGTLWLGAARGLYRYDGVRFEHIPSIPHDRDRSDQIERLFVAHDGAVWVGYRRGGLAIFRAGRLEPVVAPIGKDRVLQISAAPDGSVWVVTARTHLPISRFADGRWTRIGAESGLRDEFVTSVAFTPNGDTCVAGWETLFLRHAGESRFAATHTAVSSWAALAVDRRGQAWLSDRTGVRPLGEHLSRGEARKISAPPSEADTPIYFDRENALWIASGTGVGLVHAGERRPEFMGHSQGLTSDSTRTVMQDQEGDVWIGTSLGLDRLRPAKVIREPAVPLTPCQGYRVASDRHGTIYVANGTALYRVPKGSAPLLVRNGLTRPWALCEGSSGLWVVTDDRLWRTDGAALRAVRSPRHMGNAMGCAEDHTGALWIPAVDAGLRRYADGLWRDLKMPGIDFEDHPPGRVTLDGHGRLLLFLEGLGIARVDGLSFSIPWRFSDLPIGHPILMSAAGEDVLVGAQYGLARLRGRSITTLDSDRFGWLRNVSGIAQSPSGETWLVSADGVTRLPTAALNAAFDNPRARLAVERFELADGIPGPMNTGAGRGGVLGGDGRFWFHGEEGVAYIDPHEVRQNIVPPPVVITSVITSGTTRPATQDLALPSGTSNLQIDYTAGSLSIPERVRFRYKLDGIDADWVDPGQRRQAFYTRLGPGKYHFRVIAANDDGIWNQHGAVLNFRVPPTFVQTKLFAGLCTLAAAGALWLIYSFRVQQVADRVRASLQDRTAERERIARELHDTLLQSVQGLILKFQGAIARLPTADPGRADLERVLDQADTVLSESRDRVSDLRAVDAGNLAEDLAVLAADLLDGRSLAFEVIEEGRRRALHPVAYEEFMGIAREAIQNVCLHARADRLSLTVSYLPKKLQLSVLDDGGGIDPAVAERGREGHFGLVGMQERASRVHGLLTVMSRPGGGTEVRVTAPWSVAYANDPLQRWGVFWRRLARPA